MVGGSLNMARRGNRKRRWRKFENGAAGGQEATELSELFARVETIFAGTDFGRMAETLATMRRSLALVGDVPEFKAGQERLAVCPFFPLSTLDLV